MGEQGASDRPVPRSADTAGTGFSVWREDDHGHRFEVARALSAEEAAHRVERLEAGVHKQRYWVEATR